MHISTHSPSEHNRTLMTVRCVTRALNVSETEFPRVTVAPVSSSTSAQRYPLFSFASRSHNLCLPSGESDIQYKEFASFLSANRPATVHTCTPTTA